MNEGGSLAKAQFGPGETTEYRPLRSIQSVGGHWRGDVRVSVTNADELGIDPPPVVAGRTRQSSWAREIPTDDTPTESSSVWVELALSRT